MRKVLIAADIFLIELQKILVSGKTILILRLNFKQTKMVRTVYTSDSNLVRVPIPDRYIDTELEILVFPINEVFVSKAKRKTPDVDKSFGGWADMSKTTDEICSEIRASRTFHNRNFAL